MTVRQLNKQTAHITRTELLVKTYYIDSKIKE